jgi:hypothetical protein
VHIVGKTLTGHQHLTHTQGTLYDECLVDTYQILDPWKRQEIIADGYLASRFELVFYQHDIEDSRIEHDITMITDEGISRVNLQKLTFLIRMRPT